MPAGKIKAIQQYPFSESDRLFFDTNVWLFIYGPQGDPNDSQVRTYSGAYTDILNRNARIFIDALTLSEFINRYARLEYKFWKEENSIDVDFKEFRNSADFETIAQDIELAAHGILTDARAIESGFSKINTISLMQQYGKGKSDFNDLMIVEVCKSNQLTLITDDGDFRDADIPILTNNRRLLHGKAG